MNELLPIFELSSRQFIAVIHCSTRFFVNSTFLLIAESTIRVILIWTFFGINYRPTYFIACTICLS